MNAPFDALENIKTQLRELLKGHESKSPVAFTDIKKALPLIDNIESVLGMMVESGQILTARITRQNITDDYYWPSLMGDRMPDRSPDFKITRPVVYPLRNMQEKIPVFVKKSSAESQIMNQPDKSKSLQLLEYIEQHPDCKTQEMHFIALVPDGYLQSYVKCGNVVRRKEGRGLVFWSISPGKTVAEFYRKAAPKVEITEKSATAPKQTYFNEDGEHKTKPEPSNLLEELPEPESIPDENTQFKAAYTSDGTLMLFGIISAPIELTRNQTQQLFEFIGPQLNLVEQ